MLKPVGAVAVRLDAGIESAFADEWKNAVLVQPPPTAPASNLLIFIVILFSVSRKPFFKGKSFRVSSTFSKDSREKMQQEIEARGGKMLARGMSGLTEALF
jgi:hypothetical protein